MNSEHITIPSDAISALEDGNKVEAVRIIRDTAWVTLKQANLAVDAFLEANPPIKAKYLDSQSKVWTGVVYFVALLAIVALIVNLLR